MQVLSHLNPDSKILISHPSMYYLTSIQVPRFTSHLYILVPIFVSHLQPGRVSLPYRFPINLIHVWRCNVPPSLYVLSHILPGPLDSHLTSIPVVSQCRSWYLCLTSTHMTFQLNPVPPKLHLSPTQAPSQGYPALYTRFSHPSMSCVNCIQITRFWSHFHPFCVSPPSRCWYSCLTSIKVLYHLQPALNMCGPPPCRFHLTPIQVELWISPPSTSCLTFTKAPIFTSHLHLGRVSPQPMSRYLHLYSIQVTNQLFPVHENCISSLFRSHYKAIQASRCMSSVHPIPASPASRSQDSCITPIHVLFHLHPGH